MIAVTQIAEMLEIGLNDSAKNTNYKYSIRPEAGKYEKAKITRTSKTKVINGVLRVNEPEILPVQNMFLAQQSAMLEVVVPLHHVEPDEVVIARHRAILDGYFGSMLAGEIDGYTVTAIGTFADTGTAAPRDNVGTSFTFYINLTFIYAQNGISSFFDCYFKLDDVSVPYTTVKVNRTATVQMDAFDNEQGHSRGIETAYGYGFEFTVPASTDGAGQILLDSLFGDSVNTIHTLEVQIGKDSVPKTFKVLIGEIGIDIEGMNNAGISVSFVEAAEASQAV